MRLVIVPNPLARGDEAPYIRALGMTPLTRGGPLKGFEIETYLMYPHDTNDRAGDDYVLFDPTDVPVNATTDVAALPEYIQGRLAVLQLLGDKEWFYLAGVGCITRDGGYIIEGGE